eukprot:GHVT01073904.1.p1 GENE.GHVT01073904.1~~GHVT01073904.1.p1  ORF type:complete len:284 (-),score=59.80 GHVT01073904.1:40-891(-)
MLLTCLSHYSPSLLPPLPRPLPASFSPRYLPPTCLAILPPSCLAPRSLVPAVWASARPNIDGRSFPTHWLAAAAPEDLGVGAAGGASKFSEEFAAARATGPPSFSSPRPAPAPARASPHRRPRQAPELQLGRARAQGKARAQSQVAEKGGKRFVDETAAKATLDARRIPTSSPALEEKTKLCYPFCPSTSRLWGRRRHAIYRDQRRPSPSAPRPWREGGVGGEEVREVAEVGTPAKDKGKAWEATESEANVTNDGPRKESGLAWNTSSRQHGALTDWGGATDS